MYSMQPLDAVMTGYAYENATTTIGVLEEGRDTERWISASMLATLDNFIKVILFNERIFVTGCAYLEGNYFAARDAVCGATKASRDLLDKAQIFSSVTKIEVDAAAVNNRVVQTITPVAMQTHPLFIIRCVYPNNTLTISHEMVYLDAIFIEQAIDQFGAQSFKPVFAAEHLYLGVRRGRVPTPQATYSMSDIPGRRLRAVIRARMGKLNSFVGQGLPMLPELPPVFATRVLNDSANRRDLMRTILEIRNSAAMKNFRKWMVRCWDLANGTDTKDRAKAADALQKLNEFSPEDDISEAEFGTGLLKIVVDVLKGDPVGVISEVASPIMKYIGGIPFSGLRQFSSSHVDPKKLDRFLSDNFGDKLNRQEMDFIAILLKLPEDLTEWAREEAVFTVQGGRLDAAAPALSRPCFIQVENPAHVSNAERDFEDLLKRAERVTPEMLREWERGGGQAS
jgi:hypothetical protein